MTDTQANIGLRKSFPTLGERNFERSGTVQYKALREPLNFRGTVYHTGDLIPFDVGSPLSSYSTAAMAELRKFWDAEYIQPAT